VDRDKQQLKGSESRDAWKWWHKQPPFPKWYYGSDIDFIIVNKGGHTKRPTGIVAILDYKRPTDSVSYTECLAYDDFLRHGYLILIVQGEPHKNIDGKPFFNKDSLFSIYRYCGAVYRSDNTEAKLTLVESDLTGLEYITWEGKLRHGRVKL